MLRAVMLAAFALALASACTPDDGDSGRLIPPGDEDYADLERPEATGECSASPDCEASCEHQCAPIPTGPVTCPADPLPLPERLDQADCVCDETAVCAWYESAP
jgi:hypothetical protein